MHEEGWRYNRKSTATEMTEAEFEKYSPLGSHLIKITDGTKSTTIQDGTYIGRTWLDTVSAKLKKGPFPLTLKFCNCTENDGKRHSHNEFFDSEMVKAHHSPLFLGLIEEMKNTPEGEHDKSDNEKKASAPNDVVTKKKRSGKKKKRKRFKKRDLPIGHLRRDQRHSVS